MSSPAKPLAHPDNQSIHFSPMICPSGTNQTPRRALLIAEKDMKRHLILAIAMLASVGCASLTPEQKAEQEANARLCAKNGMLAEHEGFGYYSCHRMPGDHELPLLGD
jgi:hypothetical protein